MRQERGKCEARFGADLAYLKRRNLLTPGHYTRLTWSWLGEEIASIGVEPQPDGVRLSYVTDGERKVEFVPFTTSTTAFHGVRRWFACPSCRRRCRVVYALRGHYGCRVCGDLRYRTQSERGWARADRRAGRLRQRLGGSAGDDELPAKPKRMRWRTYRNLQALHDGLADQWAAGIFRRTFK